MSKQTVNNCFLYWFCYLVKGLKSRTHFAPVFKPSHAKVNYQQSTLVSVSRKTNFTHLDDIKKQTTFSGRFESEILVYSSGNKRPRHRLESEHTVVMSVRST